MNIFHKLAERVKRVTIKTRFAAMATILIGGISLFITAYFPAAQERKGIAEARNIALSLLDTAVFSISPALYFDDVESASEIIEGAKLNKNLSYFIVEDSEGKQFTAYNADSGEWAAAMGNPESIRVSDDGNVYQVTKDIVYNNDLIGKAYLGLSLKSIRRELEETRKAIAIASLVIFIISMIAVKFGGDMIIKPLSNMAATAEKISEGDLSQRVTISAAGEVGVLAESFNTMVANLADAHKELEDTNRNLEQMVKERTNEAIMRQKQLILADKMASLGTLVSGIAHEINNPNLFVSSNVSILGKVMKSAEPILESYYKENGDFMLGGIKYSRLRQQIPDLISGISDGSERIKSIVTELRNFAGESSSEMSESVDLNDVVKKALKLTSFLLNKTTNNLEVSYATDLPKITGNTQRLEQVVVNLLTNACHALPDKNSGIHVTVEHRVEEDNIVVTIQDEGVGIAEENLEAIFDPFFTTKRESGGTGLGLSISSTIVEEHGGALKFFSTVGKGTAAAIIIPLASET